MKEDLIWEKASASSRTIDSLPKQFGPYEILGKVGSGAMGEVYRARDTRLDRLVAIKILSRGLADDAELRRRFELEACTVSVLAHPNICPLYDIGNCDGIAFLVMEYLEGETLATRLSRRRLSIEAVLECGIEIAGALDAAHAHGVIHRDLKPANVMLTASGAKLLDFGLATMNRATPNSANAGRLGSDGAQRMAANPQTEEGVLVGTLRYMAPEQLQAGPASPASDLFALGVVLYEMATGRHPFDGTTSLELADAICFKDPTPASAVNPSVPPALSRVIKTALAKDPAQRWRAAYDLKLQLVSILNDLSIPVPARSGRAPGRPWPKWVIVAGITILFLATALSTIFRQPPRKPTIGSPRLAIIAPGGTAFAFKGSDAGPLVISPDGRQVAFAAFAKGLRYLYVRNLDMDITEQLPNTEGATFPFWSPDSSRIGFFAHGKLQTIQASAGSAGAPQTICDTDSGRGGTWSPDGTILYARTAGPLMRVPQNGGNPAPATGIEDQAVEGQRWPFFLPDGRHFLYFETLSRAVPEANQGAVYVGSLDSRQRTLIIKSDSNVIYASGYLLYLDGGSLMARPFDTRNLKAGQARLIATTVSYDAQIWRGVFSASQTGILTFASASASDARVTAYDSSGRELAPMLRHSDTTSLRLSHDGRKLALDIYDQSTRQRDIWIYDMARREGSKIAGGTFGHRAPVWAPDGKRLVFSRLFENTRALFQKNIDPNTSEELLLRMDGLITPTDWSLDGRYIAFNYYPPEANGKSDIYVLPMQGARTPLPFVRTQANETSAVFSPDGRWVAYAAREQFHDEIFLAPFPDPKWKRQISAAGGSTPRWDHSGKRLFYLAPDRQLMVVDIRDKDGTLHVGRPHALFQTHAKSIYSGYDVLPDGQRFIMSVEEQTDSQPVNVVVNWTSELTTPFQE